MSSRLTKCFFSIVVVSFLLMGMFFGYHSHNISLAAGEHYNLNQNNPSVHDVNHTQSLRKSFHHCHWQEADSVVLNCISSEEYVSSQEEQSGLTQQQKDFLMFLRDSFDSETSGLLTTTKKE